jgi:hypothetical protein
MARKRTLNRMDYRGDAEEEGGEPKAAAEDEEIEDDEDAEDEEDAEGDGDSEEGSGGDDDDEAPKPAKKSKKKAATTAPKRTRAPKVVRMKAVWVVYDNSSKQMETFPFNQKAEAETYMEQKNVDRKGACYIQLVKVPYDDK